MADRFESREALAGKIEWEGGLSEAFEHGITADEMPEGDTELRDAWAKAEAAYRVFRAALEPLEALLPD